MPHITLEHSGNVSIDFQQFFTDLAKELVATGEVPELGIKCRAVASQNYYIVDGNPKYQMANLFIRLREGRSLAIKKLISEIAMRTMETYFKDAIENKQIILSTELKELEIGIDLTKNAIR